MRMLIVAAVILLAAPARAQDTPVVDIGVGYAFLHDDEVDENFSKGWVASLNLNFTRGLALTGEVGGSYTSVPSGDDVPVDLDLSVDGVDFGDPETQLRRPARGRRRLRARRGPVVAAGRRLPVDQGRRRRR